MIITDFDKSFIGWFGESNGKFKLASTLTYYNNLNEKVTYGLSQSVLAGNVYGKSDLIKNPYYIFQVFHSGPTYLSCLLQCQRLL